MSIDEQLQAIIDRAGPEAQRRMILAEYKRHPDWMLSDVRAAMDGLRAMYAKIGAAWATAWPKPPSPAVAWPSHVLHPAAHRSAIGTQGSPRPAGCCSEP